MTIGLFGPVTQDEKYLNTIFKIYQTDCIAWSTLRDTSYRRVVRFRYFRLVCKKINPICVMGAQYCTNPMFQDNSRKRLNEGDTGEARLETRNG